jgi:hypothetical protein
MKGNKNDGLFVNAKIHNTEVHCLIDTGSTMSVLHTTVFDQLPGRLIRKCVWYGNNWFFNRPGNWSNTVVCKTLMVEPVSIKQCTSVL